MRAGSDRATELTGKWCERSRTGWLPFRRSHAFTCIGFGVKVLLLESSFAILVCLCVDPCLHASDALTWKRI